LNVIAGQTITYTYSVANIALLDVHNASGLPVIPTGETLATPGGMPVSATTADLTGDNIWDALGPGDIIEFTGTYIVTQSDVDIFQ